VGERRAYPVTIAGDARIAATDDAARLRDALGVAVPQGLPIAFTDPVPDPVGDLVARYARTHGPFLTAEVAARWGLDRARVEPKLLALEEDGRLVRGEFRPDGHEREWCDPDVLRQIRRRSLAALRNEIEPVDGSALARFLPLWQGIGSPRRGLDALADVLAQLQGAAIPVSVLEADVLPARLDDYRPADLDALTTSGDIVWIGAGPLGATDGRVRLVFRDQAALLVPDAGDDPPSEPIHQVLLDHLTQRGASFWPDLQRAVRRQPALRGRAGARRPVGPGVGGLVTNDSLAPLRNLNTRGGRRTAGAAPAPAGADPAAWPAPAHPPPPGAGRSPPACSNPDPRPPRPPTPGPTSCSTATACSPARRRWARGPRAGSPACTPSSRPSRTGARCGGATSSPASAPPSSPCPARSTACGRCASGATTPARSSCSPPPTPPSPTAPPSAGPPPPRPPAVPPAPPGRS
jgi:ATP-dependent helicase Lhr and Lhr-like helicase